jgi:chloramphenicol O-acetyltransferase type A
MEPKFTPIDPAKWPRGEMFYYYSEMAPTGYTIDVTVDVTNMKKALKDKSMKFFPAYLYIVTRALNEQIEMKTAYADKQIGYWSTLTPMYAAFHDNDKTISLMWTEYDNDFSVFYNNYREDQRLYGEKHGALAKPAPPPSCYIVSCVPWISFNSFSLHSYGNSKYFFPSVEAGKFTDSEGRLTMPLSITLHHATTDGYHVQQFLKELQRLLDEPDIWL